GTYDSVTAHSGEYESKRPGTENRSDRRQHRIDRRHAAAAASALGQAHHGAVLPRVHRKVRIAGRDQDVVGLERHAVLRNHGWPMRDGAELAREYRHERKRQMLGQEDWNADPLG